MRATITGRHVAVARPLRPASLEGEALAEWRRVTAELAAMGLLARVDRAALVRHCRFWQDWCEIDAALIKSGALVHGHHGLMRNPLWRLRSDVALHMAELAKQLGLTPAARLRAGIEHDLPSTGSRTRAPVTDLARERWRRLTDAG